MAFEYERKEYQDNLENISVSALIKITKMPSMK